MNERLSLSSLSPIANPTITTLARTHNDNMMQESPTTNLNQAIIDFPLTDDDDLRSTPIRGRNRREYNLQDHMISDDERSSISATNRTITRNIVEELDSIQNDLSRISQNRVFEDGIMDATEDHQELFSNEEKLLFAERDKVLHNEMMKTVSEDKLLDNCSVHIVGSHKTWQDEFVKTVLDVPDWKYVFHSELVSKHRF